MIDEEIVSGDFRDCVSPSSGDYSWLCIQSSKMIVIRDDRSGKQPLGRLSTQITCMKSRQPMQHPNYK